MNDASQGGRSQRMLPAYVFGLIATFFTSGLVSWSTPDGNLVVTLVPALILGLVVFGFALWRIRRDQLK